MRRRGCLTILALLAVIVILASLNRNVGTRPANQAAPAGFTEAPNAATKDAAQGTARILAQTATVTPSATITDTPTNAPTTAATATPLAVRSEVQVTPLSETMYVMQTANARRCPSTDCEIVGKFQKGMTFGADGAAKGDAVSGNPIWYRTRYLGQVVYVNSSLVVNYDSVAQPQSAQSQSQPVQQQPATQGFSCPSNCTEAVEMGLSAQQAASCGLDRDGDGVACYGD